MASPSGFQCVDSSAKALPPVVPYDEVPHPGTVQDPSTGAWRCQHHQEAFDKWTEREGRAARRLASTGTGRGPRPYLPIPRPKPFREVSLSKPEADAISDAIGKVAVARAGLDQAKRTGRDRLTMDDIEELQAALDELFLALGPVTGQPRAGSRARSPRGR